MRQREIERLTRRREPIPFVWRGIDWWRCPFCAWDRDDQAAVQAHIDGKHPEDVPTELQRMTAQAQAAEEPETDAVEEPAAAEELSDAQDIGDEDDEPVPEPDGGGGGDGSGGGHGEFQSGGDGRDRGADGEE